MNRPMDDMNCIIAETQDQCAVWLGNIKAAQNMELLSQNKIGAVLSCLPVKENPLLKFHSIIPAQDVDDFDLSKYFDSSFEFIEKARKSTGILIHCQAGISRSTTILIAYMVRKYMYGVKEALEMIEAKRWQIFPNNGFLRQLQKFEKEFFIKFTRPKTEAYSPYRAQLTERSQERKDYYSRFAQIDLRNSSYIPRY